METRDIIGKKCHTASLIAGLYPRLDFGDYSLEVGPAFWVLLHEESIQTHCYQLSDISEYYLEKLIGNDLVDISTNIAETNIKIGNYVLRINAFEKSRHENFSIFKSQKEIEDDITLQELRNRIPEVYCQKISNTYGSTLLIDFGDIQVKGKYPLTVMIETSKWSILNQSGDVQTSSDFIVKELLNKILNTKLIEIELNKQDFSSRLTFSNGLILRTLPSGLNTPHWTIGLSDTHITYGPKDNFGYSK